MQNNKVHIINFTPRRYERGVVPPRDRVYVEAEYVEAEYVE